MMSKCFAQAACSGGWLGLVIGTLGLPQRHVRAREYSLAHLFRSE